MLTALLAQTRRLRGGLLVTSSIYRNPGVLAKIGATLDIATGGRLEMGLGAGWFEEEARAFGMPFPPTGQRLAMLDETIQILQALWTQEVSTFQGQHFTLKDARCNPKPLQKPTPPIWVGGQGEKVTLRIVAQRADGWDMDMAPIADYRRKLNVLSEHCAAAGRDPLSVKKMIHFSGIVAENERDVKRQAEALAASWKTSVEDLRGRVLIGTPEQAAEQLWSYIELGASHLVLSLQAPYDMRMIELFIGEVAPRVERIAYIS
jgi:alkanesulfonate monooxygenase SsuD/methylene tetrahydromethanopterin reductase-like flavin-dependent oxidoreductase (luciferase family)